jgi:hypothetical protein
MDFDDFYKVDDQQDGQSISTKVTACLVSVFDRSDEGVNTVLEETALFKDLIDVLPLNIPKKARGKDSSVQQSLLVNPEK